MRLDSIKLQITLLHSCDALWLDVMQIRPSEVRHAARSSLISLWVCLTIFKWNNVPFVCVWTVSSVINHHQLEAPPIAAEQTGTHRHGVPQMSIDKSLMARWPVHCVSADCTLMKGSVTQGQRVDATQTLSPKAQCNSPRKWSPLQSHRVAFILLHELRVPVPLAHCLIGHNTLSLSLSLMAWHIKKDTQSAN